MLKRKCQVCHPEFIEGLSMRFEPSFDKLRMTVMYQCLIGIIFPTSFCYKKNPAHSRKMKKLSSKKSTSSLIKTGTCHEVKNETPVDQNAAQYCDGESWYNVLIQQGFPVHTAFAGKALLHF